MKIKPLIPRIAALAVIAALLATIFGCKPASDEVETPVKDTNQPLAQAQAGFRDVSSDISAYSYSQKNEFVSAMEMQLSALNKNLDELATSIARSSTEVKLEAEPKLKALRGQAGLLEKQLDKIKDTSALTWGSIKANTSNAYGELKDGFNQARKWLDSKIAP